MGFFLLLQKCSQGGKKKPNLPYKIKVTANYGEGQVSKVFEQKVTDIIIQEYWDHYPYKTIAADNNPAHFRRINCRSGFFTGDGVCTNVHSWPQPPNIIQPTATNHYTNSSGCGSLGTSNCLTIVSANYANVQGKNFTLGAPLIYAEEIWTRYNNDLRSAGPAPTVTPRVTSGWRNPERNEAVGGVINSNHQWGATVDLLPEVFNNVLEIVNDPNKPGLAARTWCQLAASAYAVEGTGTLETLIENNRGFVALPSKIYFRYHANPDFQACVSAVQSAIGNCLTNNYGPEPVHTEPQRASCSPDHVHTAR